MTQSNAESMQQIHKLCNELLDKLAQDPSTVGDKEFLYKKQQILQRILIIQNTTDLALYLDSSINNEDTNQAILMATNATWKRQYDIYIAQEKERLSTLWETHSKSSLPVLIGLMFVYLLQYQFFQILCFLIAANKLLSSLAIVNKMFVRAQNIHKQCEDFSKEITDIIKITEVVPLAQNINDFFRASTEGNVLDSVAKGACDHEQDEQGNTILHKVVSYKVPGQTTANIEKIQASVGRLHAVYKYHRNQSHETPVMTLKDSDPYHLKALFKLDDILPIGDILSKVDDYLALLKRKPKETSRLLLLEGPSGAGKSKTVETYLGKQKKCVIETWVVGDESDKYMAQLEARITQVFNKVIAQAKKDPGKTHIIFLDKMESICPNVVPSGEHSVRSRLDSFVGIGEQFQRQIEGIQRTSPNIFVVGTTMSALRIASSLRGMATRILYKRPTEAERLLLLQHFFIEKRISEAEIKRIAYLTEGWSARGLASIVNELPEQDFDMRHLERAMHKSAILMETDFNTIHSHAVLYLPRWKNTEDESEYPIVTPQSIATCFEKLSDYLDNQKYYTRTPMHVLLSGPPGGGKTTAVRNFAQRSNIPFVLVKTGIMSHEMTYLLEDLNGYRQALLFIDELDQCPYVELLQTHMDGFKENNTILIGATNHPALIQAKAALWDRFFFKVYVPALSEEQRKQYISWIIGRELELEPRVSIAEDFVLEFGNNCPTLTQVSQKATMRSIGWGLQSLFGLYRSKVARGEETDITLQVVTDTLRNVCS
jgi:SpoVK/Ycf46/Vps4 family AAA+-type ATPase